MTYVPSGVLEGDFGASARRVALSAIVKLTGLVTDTATELVPSNAVVEAVTWRITRSLVGKNITGLSIGDATTPSRFLTTASLAAGSAGVALESVAAGRIQGPSGTTLRVTVLGDEVTGGELRLTVFATTYMLPIA